MGTTKLETKVFKVEIAKPSNYDWRDFSSILNKTSYWAAQLANQVMIRSYLEAKGETNRNGQSFCAAIPICKEIAPIVSSVVRCATCRQAQHRFRTDRRKILRGDITLPSFKNNLCFLRKEGVQLCQHNDQWIARLKLLPGHDQKQPEVILKTSKMKRETPGYYQILERIASDQYKQGFTQIKRDKQRNKIYLLISYSFEPNRDNGLNRQRVMGVDLGVSTPAYCAFNDSLRRKNFIVEGKKLLRAKYQIQSRRRDMQRELGQRDIRRGHGLDSKFNPSKEIRDKWNNFRRTWNHTLAKRIAEYAVANQAGTIHLEKLSGNGKFLGADWPVNELLQFIQYKSEEAGIEIRYVNSYKTSMTCSRCGCINEEFTFDYRKAHGFPKFVCKECNFQDHADYNAAKNVAKSTLTVV